MGVFVGASMMATSVDSVVYANGSTASFFISAPGVEGPPALAGLTMETFDNLTPGNKAATSALEIGSISAGSLNVLNCSGSTCWAGAATSSSTPIPSVFSLPATTPNTNYPYNNKTPFAYPSLSVTIQLNRAVNYFGFYWAAGSGSNTVKLFTGSTLVASFSTSDLNSLIPTSRTDSGATVAVNGGGTYEVDNYRGGHKSAWDSWYTTSGGINCSLASSNTWSVDCWNPQQFAYVHAVVPQGFTFDKVQLIANDFEFDNLAIANYTGAFDPTGLVGVPLSNASVTPTLTPATHTVTFDANDGSGITATQTASVATALRANTFTRNGFTFDGWGTSSTSAVSDYSDQDVYQFTASTTLYARWLPIPAVSPSEVSTTPTPTAHQTVARVSEIQLPKTGNSPFQLFTVALGMMAIGISIVARRRVTPRCLR